MLMHSCAQTVPGPILALTFPEGIYGFEDVRSFTLLRGTREDNPIRWLRRLTNCIFSHRPRLSCRLRFRSPENMIKLVLPIRASLWYYVS